MKINFKERLKNKTFLISAIALIVAFVYQIIALFGIVPAVSEEAVMQIISLGINFLAFIGVLIDPTTEGVSDSPRALTYGTDEDVRVLESKQNEDESYKKENEKYSVEAHYTEESVEGTHTV